jgi:hypothetical protein
MLRKTLALLVMAAMIAVPAFALDELVLTESEGFASFSGIIKEVKDAEAEDAEYFVLLENGEGGQAEFYVSADTYLVYSNTEIKEGENAVGFYETPEVMTLQYPPRYTAEVFAVGEVDGQTVAVDRFDEDFVSYDGNLKLNISDETDISYEDGKAFEGEPAELAGRKLAVVYSVSTKSIPAQTSPEKIVILYEKAVALPGGGIDVISKSDITAKTGTVIKVEDKTLKTAEGTVVSSLITIEDSEGGYAIFYADANTFYADGKEAVVEGAVISGYYFGHIILPLIYPPVYPAFVIASLGVKIDRFNQDFVSYDGQLKLDISDETKISYSDGKEFDGELADLSGRQLVVYYDIAAESFPAQTTPTEIVILYEKAVTIPAELYAVDYENVKGLTVNGKKIDEPETFINGEGVFMLPLRAVAEALGYTVEWDNERNAVAIGGYVAELTIGGDYYSYLRTAPIQLGTAPVLVDDAYTYVPAEFFGSVIPGINVKYDLINGQYILSKASE